MFSSFAIVTQLNILSDHLLFSALSESLAGLNQSMIDAKNRFFHVVLPMQALFVEPLFVGAMLIGSLGKAIMMGEEVWSYDKISLFY